MTTTLGTISLQDFNNDVQPVTELWFCGVGHPAGLTYIHDVQSDDEAYCDVTELIDDLGLWELTGTVTDGRWEWDGTGKPTDLQGNSILNVKAN